MNKSLFGVVVLTVALVGCSAPEAEVDTSHHDPALLESVLEDVRVGWEQGSGEPFYTHFLDWDGARYFEGDFAWALVDTDVQLTTADGRDIHNRGHGTYLFRWVDGAWKVVHSQSASSPVKEG